MSSQLYHYTEYFVSNYCLNPYKVILIKYLLTQSRKLFDYHFFTLKLHRQGEGVIKYS